MDYREKTINDLEQEGIIVKPNSYLENLFLRKFIELNEPLKNTIDNFPSRLSFKNFSTLTEEEQAIFATNYFVDVDDGDKASGVVRIYFESPTDLFVDSNTYFITNTNMRFKTTESSSITEDEMLNYTEGLYYYFEVNIESENPGERYNIEPGTIVACENPSINGKAVKIENPYKLDSGTNPETAEELYNRVYDSITVRNLTNAPAISSILRENFNILDVFVVGHGDEDMKRDIEVIGGVEYRVGNKFDIYTYTNNTQYTVTMNKDDDEVNFGYGEVDTSGVTIPHVVLYIEEIKDVTDTPITDYHFEQTENLENSIEQGSKIIFEDDSTEEITITYIASPTIDDIHDFTMDSNNRLPVGDPLVKHFELFYFYGTIEYRGDVEEEEMQEGINNYLKYYDYNPNRVMANYEESGNLRKNIEISDIVSKLYELGAVKVAMPVTLSIERPYPKELETPESFTSDYDTFVSLDNLEIIVNSETVSSGATTYIRGTDYNMNYADGEIEVISSGSGGSMSDSTSYDIDYKYKDIEEVTDELEMKLFQSVLPDIVVTKEEGA